MVSREAYNTLATFLAATYRRIEIMVKTDTPTQLYYFCDKHLNMGNSVTVIAGKTGEWQLGQEYKVNEVVYHLGNAYKNNTQHIADNNNYPGDNGSGYVYWDLLVQAGQPAGMNTRGDLLTFNLNRREQDDGSSFGNTNVPIGRKEQLLSIEVRTKEIKEKQSHLSETQFEIRRLYNEETRLLKQIVITERY